MSLYNVKLAFYSLEFACCSPDSEDSCWMIDDLLLKFHFNLDSMCDSEVS